MAESMVSGRYQITQVDRCSSHVLKIILMPLDQALPYQAGQYAWLQLEHSRHEALPFSIANAPSVDGRLVFHVRINHQTPDAKTFCVGLEKDAIMWVRDVSGHCVYPLKSSPWILAVGGTGMAPAIAWLEAAAEQQDSRPWHVYWAVNQAKGCYALKQCCDLLSRLPGMHLTVVFRDAMSIDQPQVPDDFGGRYRESVGLLADCLALDYPDLSSYHVMAAGPAGLVQALRASCARARLFCSDV